MSSVTLSKIYFVFYKRGASAIKKRLSKVGKTKVKGAKLAEARTQRILDLYTKAAKQRAIQGEIENRGLTEDTTRTNEKKTHVNEGNGGRGV